MVEFLNRYCDLKRLQVVETMKSKKIKKKSTEKGMLQVVEKTNKKRIKRDGDIAPFSLK